MSMDASMVTGADGLADGSQDAEQMMRLAVEAAPNGMIMTDATGRIVMVNSMAESQFGYPRQDMIGAPISLLVPDRFKPQHAVLSGDYHARPETRAMSKRTDLYGQHRDGHEFPVEIGLNPIRTGQGMMILASVIDITERKQHEEKLRASLKEKEVLLSEIHHRVKNNLQIIDSLIAMQLDNVDDARAIALLQDSRHRIKSMALIHQILYQSQDFSQVDMASVLRDLVANLAQSYGVALDRRMCITIDSDEIFLPIDTSIPLGLIVNELVSNVFKHAFTVAGGGVVSVRLKRLDTGQIKLTVSDDGIGLRPEQEAGPSATSLGLRLVEALTDQLEGELSIHPRQPTRFEVSFAG